MNDRIGYLLRVEAVNLGHFVYDTDKIQPIRGGSFLLLESVQNIGRKDEKENMPEYAGATLEKITTGASIGLFAFSLENGEEADKKADEVASAVQECLRKSTGGHATFVVDWVRKTGNFKRDLETLQAKNRWRQYRQPTLILPDIPDMAGTKECEYDGVRPGVRDVPGPDGKNEKLSSSVAFRKQEGSSLKKKIYTRILGREIKDQFTDDLGELAEITGKGNLGGKIAFLYLDGNRFGTIRSQLCRDEGSLKAFGDTVEGARKEFLANLLGTAAGQADFRNGKILRIETLLWGGDELEIVVPAWKGWETVRMFFDHTKKTSFPPPAGSGMSKPVPLTHAGGLVFCSCKAPILEVRRMAHELADAAKEKIGKEIKDKDKGKEIHKIGREKHDLILALTLESFDILPGTTESFIEEYYGKDAPQNLLLTAGDAEKLAKVLASMRKGGFPRNKLFDCVRVVRKGEDPAGENGPLEDALAGLREADKLKTEITGFVNGNRHRWYLLCDQWDYAGEKS